MKDYDPIFWSCVDDFMNRVIEFIILIIIDFVMNLYFWLRYYIKCVWIYATLLYAPKTDKCTGGSLNLIISCIYIKSHLIINSLCYLFTYRCQKSFQTAKHPSQISQTEIITCPSWISQFCRLIILYLFFRFLLVYFTLIPQ